MIATGPRAASFNAQQRSRRASTDRADTHINNMLWMHNEARHGRPSASTLRDLGARYPKGVRFRVHQDVVRLSVGTRTLFKPVIEILTEVNRRWRWVTYMWLDHEGLFE